MTDARSILDFWLRLGPAAWFRHDPAFDGQVAVRFSGALAAARLGEYDHWAETPEGALGLVILLDQMSRNIHRGTPLMFGADLKALRVAENAVARGFHHRIPQPEALWFYMPFEHAENLEAQSRCIGLFAASGLAWAMPWAILHRDIIVRFGRFPHRNAILGRKSTQAELNYLAGGGFSG